MEPTRAWLEKARTPLEWLERSFEIKYDLYMGNNYTTGLSQEEREWAYRVWSYISEFNECRDLFELIPDHDEECAFCERVEMERDRWI